MEKSRFTHEQIAFALKQAESGVPVEEVYRKLGISQQTFYRWNKEVLWIGCPRGTSAKAVGRREPEAETVVF